MTIDEAIKILTIQNDHNHHFIDADRNEAHQLGIEALKAMKILRSPASPHYPHILPGETK